MKKKLYTRLLGFLILGLVLFPGIASAQNVLGIGTATGTTTVTVPVTLNNISGSIEAYQFDLNFDATKLTYSSVSIASTISSSFSIQANVISSGILRIAAGGTSALSASSPPDDLLFVTFTVNAGASGAANFSFSNILYNEGTPTGSGTAGSITVNSGPTFVNQTVTATHLAPLTYQVAATANAGGTLSYSFPTMPAGLIGNTTTGVISGNPSALGVSSLEVTVSETGGGSTTATVTINVKVTLEVTSATLTGNTADPFTYQVIASDPGANIASYAITGQPPGLDINTETGEITGTATATGQFVGTVTVTNEFGTSLDGTITITISEGNVPPVWTPTSSGAVTVPAGSPFEFDFGSRASDENTFDVGQLQFAIERVVDISGNTITTPSDLTINASTGILQWTNPVAGFLQIHVSVTDSRGAASIFFLDVTVQGDNSPPEIPLGITVDGITTNSAIVSFTANEPTTAVLTLWIHDDIFDIFLPGVSFNLSLNQTHSLTLTDLFSNATYRVDVLLRDEANNHADFTGPVFTTLATPDVTGPVISPPNPFGLTDVSVTIKWTTDEPATSAVAYGLATAGTLPDTARGTGTTKEHAVLIEGLTPGTQYNYRVISTDASDNTSVREEASFLTFTTEATPDNDPPVISGVLDQGATQDKVTIVWTTNEIATSEVHYRPKGELTFRTPVTSSTLTTDHSILLTNLVADTTYEYFVKSVDGSGNADSSGTLTFKTLAEPDVTPPQIVFQPDVTGITDSRATVGWTTNEAGNSKVEFGITTSFERQPVTESDPVETHSVDLTNLIANTLYYFRVSTTDLSNNTVTSAIDSFRTEPGPDETPPVILTGPIAKSPTERSVQIEWTTDELTFPRVDFGITKSFGKSDIGTVALDAHVRTLTNLVSDTLYFYQVTSTDNSNNSTVSAVDSFRTLAAPDTDAPTFEENPDSKSETQNSVTITWKTNEPADSKVVFDTTNSFTSALLNEKKSGSPTTDHELILTNLLSDQRYFFKVFSKDFSRNELESGVFEFKTLAEPDVTPPVIELGPSVSNPTVSSATIEWSTNENASSIVEFSPDSLLKGGVAVNPASLVTRKKSKLVTVHSVALTNLEAGTQYFYRVRSVDLNKNEVSSETAFNSFYTKTAPDNTPPKITQQPFIIDKTPTSATITWKTNEPATSVVEWSSSIGTTGKKESAVLVENHKIVLTLPKNDGLVVPTYFLTVKSTDFAKNTVTKNNAAQFTLPNEVTNEPPEKVLSVTSRTTPGGVYIEWTSTRPYDSRITDLQIKILNPRTRFANLSLQSDSRLVTNHSMLLTGLPTSESIIKVKVRQADINGLVSQESRFFLFRLNFNADTTPPQITAGPSIKKSGSSVSITWTTNEAANSVVYYMKKTDPAGTVPEKKTSSTLTPSHQITITDLDLNATYLFVVTSTDRANNRVVNPSPKPNGFGALYKASGLEELLQVPGSFGEFSTDSEEDTNAPTIISGPTLVNKTSTTATISWKTDELSSSIVDFGTTTNYGNTAGTNANAEEHTVILNNLTPGTLYNYRVSSTDISGNAPALSANKVLTTSTEADVIPPVISSKPVVASKSDNQVTINWKTNELSSSRVEFSTNNDFLLEEELPAESVILSKNVLNHSVTLTNLSPGTMYYYRVSSLDISQNETKFSKNTTFTTLEEPDVTLPVVSDIEVTALTNTRATVTWKTDKLSDSFVLFDVEGVALTDGTGSSDDVFEHRITLTKLQPATTYTYAVVSTDQFGNESLTSEAKTFVTAAVADETPPEVPENVTVVPGDRANHISWDAVPDAAGDLAGYNVYRETVTVAKSSAAHAGFVLIASNVTETSYVDAGLVNGETYNYQVTSIDNITNNESAVSNTDTAVPDETLKPGKPDIVSPLDGSVASTFNFITNNVESTRQPVTYEFMIASDSSFLEIITYEVNVSQGSPSTTTFEQILDVGDYYWRVRANDGFFTGEWSDPAAFTVDVVTDVDDEEPVRIPTDFELHDNYPNPFNPETNIKFELPAPSDVQIVIYNVRGQVVKTLVNQEYTAGVFVVKWNGRNDYGLQVGSGIYIFRIKAGKFVKSQKMVLIK